MTIKKMILAILILFFFVSLPAATFKAGTKSVGGSVSFGIYKYGGDSPTSYGLGLGPAGSYFIVDNVCLDVSPSIGIYWVKGGDTNTSLGFKLGGRYFYKNFYGGARFHYFHSSSKDTDFKQTEKTIEFLGGYLFPLKENIYLDLGIKYTKGIGKVTGYGTSGSGDYSYDNDLSQFSTAFGVAIFFR